MSESLLPDVPIAFGLRAQGHIPTVRRMLQEGHSWAEIGAEIGWDGATAMRFYRDDYEAVDELADRLLDGITVVLQAFTTEQLRAIADHREEINAEGWIHPLIREYAEVHRD